MSYNVIYEYGNMAGPGPSYFQAWVGARVVDENATHVRVEGGQAIWACTGSGFGGSYVNTSGTDGQGGANLYGEGWYADTSWHDMGWYERGSTVYLWVNAWYESGSVGHCESRVEGWWTVPARDAHGSPSLTANKQAVSPGESVTLTWARSSYSGNARFWCWEIFADGEAILLGSQSTQMTVVPSDRTGGASGTVVYRADEVHEWWGTYPRTSASVTVEVLAESNVNVYDSSGALRQGILSAYDGAGSRRNVLITAYDATGRRRDVLAP